MPETKHKKKEVGAVKRQEGLPDLGLHPGEPLPEPRGGGVKAGLVGVTPALILHGLLGCCWAVNHLFTEVGFLQADFSAQGALGSHRDRI